MSVMEKPSGKSVFIWNILGSACNALSSMLLLVFVNRILGTAAGDTFSIGFSIATLMASIGLFQVRVYQSTDVTNRFSFGDYFALRIVTCALMLAVSVLYLLRRGYGADKYLIALMLCGYKLVDAFSDVFQGLFQQKEHLDISGKAIVWRILISNGGFFLALVLSKSLSVSAGVLLAGSVLAVLIYDVPQYRRFSRTFEDSKLAKPLFNLSQLRLLITICFPLFLNAYLMNAVYNQPKLAIDTAIETGVLGQGLQSYYNILFMPASVINLFLIVFRPLLTTLAHHYVDRDFGSFNRILLRIIAGLFGFGLLALAAAAFLGIPVLSLVYGTGEGLAPYRPELLLLIAGGGLNSIANMLDNAVTIIRRQQYLLISYALSALSAMFLAKRFVLAYGLRGAVYTYLVSIVILLAGNAVIYRVSMRKMQKEK
ncbi:MAG: lipopolysaccharide biosynthesis protein [Firmicutes bacterium]|nr:lipopolysaccharide biosynthesis protein [Bacillota bacterium]